MLKTGSIRPSFIIGFPQIKESEKSAFGFLIIDKASKNSDIEIIYPNGVRVKVENDVVLLSQLIRLNINEFVSLTERLLMQIDKEINTENRFIPLLNLD
ncbi:hypothetical protein D3C86_223630 [compost metagenome]